jgi:hypothetical protein
VKVETHQCAVSGCPGGYVIALDYYGTDDRLVPCRREGADVRGAAGRTFRLGLQWA